MSHLFFLLAAGALLAGCADQPDAPPNAEHFGPPQVMNGMTPSTGMGGFKGAGSWGPENSPFQQSGAEQLKGFRGF